MPFSDGSIFPSQNRPRRPGNLAFSQLETRSYIFGAIRNLDDSFASKFLEELRSRPDLFHVVTRSDTDPEGVVETFGHPPGSEYPINTRGRQFEAPRGATQREILQCASDTPWENVRTGREVLYHRKKGQTDPSIEGYLISKDSRGWFFRFKKFDVKYFVIIDAKPGRQVDTLARLVSWAALCAAGYGRGEHTDKKYAAAADMIYQAHAERRLSWMGENAGWKATKLSEDEELSHDDPEPSVYKKPSHDDLKPSLDEEPPHDDLKPSPNEEPSHDDPETSQPDENPSSSTDNQTCRII
jgi:hypothetical protein